MHTMHAASRESPIRPVEVGGRAAAIVAQIDGDGRPGADVRRRGLSCGPARRPPVQFVMLKALLTAPV